MVRVFLLIVVSVALCFDEGKASVKNTVVDPDMRRNVSELITSKGYPLEEHTVQTADGYLLSVQRIPHGRKDNLEGGERKVVLLIHGIMCDGSVWVLDFPDQSLGFQLPDAGYDTWLLNMRGTSYSRKHIHFTTKQIEFWDFSFDEMGQYDIPATIDYILETTRKEALYIIGHSQGTTAVFAMLSEKPDYNDKVKLFIALAPVAFVWHSTSSCTSFVPFAEEIAFFSNMFYSGELFPMSTKKFSERICRDPASKPCKRLFTSVIGADKMQYNQTRFSVYVAHYPSSCSVRSLHHYAQMFVSRKFRKFDYGPENLELYNQEEPPDYELSRITAPVALFWSANDIIADPEDIDILRKQLKFLVFDYRIPFEYNHRDFFIALNSPQMVNQPALQLLAQY